MNAIFPSLYLIWGQPMKTLRKTPRYHQFVFIFFITRIKQEQHQEYQQNEKKQTAKESTPMTGSGI